MSEKKATIRFYEELNDFLPPAVRKSTLPFRFFVPPSIKDVIESFGVPHTEVDLILANGKSVDFEYHLEADDRISVYPVFESIDISNVTRLRPQPLRNTAFILDVHLGKVSKELRMLGFDSLYRNDYKDAEIVRISTEQHRIILTRDRELLKHGQVTHGYFVRATKPSIQTEEIIRRFDLVSQIKPFHRCMVCNGLIRQVEKPLVEPYLKKKTKEFYHQFFQCRDCEKIYWKGSHFLNMQKRIETLKHGKKIS